MFREHQNACHSHKWDVNPTTTTTTIMKPLNGNPIISHNNIYIYINPITPIMVICWSLVKPLMAKIMTFHCYPLGIAETLRGDEPPLACAARTHPAPRLGNWWGPADGGTSKWIEMMSTLVGWRHPAPVDPGYSPLNGMILQVVPYYSNGKKRP